MTQQTSKGVLLINLGSPDSPATADIRRYLREFLSDKRVMTMPALIRWLLVNLYIAPFRPTAIRKNYERIWSDQGFPLIKHSLELAAGVSRELGKDYHVEMGMRYGKPNLEDNLERFRRAGIEKLLIFPLFPQYSSATTGSINEKILETIKNWQVIPETIVTNSFYAHPEFIEAWLSQARNYYDEIPDHTLFSFHGLPESHILKADTSGNHCLKTENCCQTVSKHHHGCYRAHCFQSAFQIAAGLNLPTTHYSISFQSRLGRTKWLEPYTVEHVKELARKGTKKLLVFCPSFVADCLETIDEIQIEIKEAFLAAGGESLTLIPSLNSSQRWINSLAAMIREKL